MFSNVFAPRSAAKIQKIIEKSKIKDFHEKSLKILIRDLPKNPFFLWKLSAYYLNNGDCPKVLGIKMPLFKMNPKQEAGLLEHKARCFLDNKSFDEAEKTLQKMTRLVPTDWRVHYQLGNAYYKNKNKFKATSSYRETISLKPPKPYAEIINRRLDELGVQEENK
tara:strand:- start:150 stop:644 length:495 start_codon:yes stop_codon:yes gene_type:complete